MDVAGELVPPTVVSGKGLVAASSTVDLLAEVTCHLKCLCGFEALEFAVQGLQICGRSRAEAERALCIFSGEISVPSGERFYYFLIFIYLFFGPKTFCF